MASEELNMRSLLQTPRTDRALVAACSLALVLGAMSATVAVAQSETTGPSAQTCEASHLVADITAADVQGTTFVGTYLGDTVGGVDSPRPLITSWSVERVYAGGPIPADLIFETPGCEWTNLTPGVRYLFSTAATDLHHSSADSGMPTIVDSLA
jgi:hypothetical protein